MAATPRDYLPLKDLVFRILLELADGEQHGWGLVQALADSGSGRLLPGHLYRTLDRLLADGLITERDQPMSAQPRSGRRGTAPSRFFQLTPLGRDVARAETRRLEALVRRSRSGSLLKERP